MIRASPLTNPVATIEQLRWNVSGDNIPNDLRELVRYEASRLINAAGILLRMPQHLIAQAIVLLCRYWTTPGISVSNHDAKDVSAAALYLVTKPSGHSISPRLLLTVFEFLIANYPDYDAALKQDASTSWSMSDGKYESLRTRLYTIEGHMLTTLGFDIHVALPHAVCINYLQALDAFTTADGATLAKESWHHLNSALISPQLLYLTYQPSVLAVSAIYLAARELSIKLPETQWWEVFDVDREDLGFVVVAYLSIDEYGRMAKEQRQHTNLLLREGLETRLKVGQEG